MASQEDLVKDSKLWDLAMELDIENWDKIGIELGLSNNEVKNIQEIHRYRNFRDRAYAMLIVWKNKTPEELKVEKLVEVLEKNGEKFVANNIRRLFSAAVEDIRETDVIARGTKAIICRKTYKGKECAMKKYSKDWKSVIENEKKILTSIPPGNQSIIGYFGLEEDPSCYYGYYELCHGNLKEYVTTPGKFRGNHWKQPIDLMRELTEGLRFLHHNHIIHGDIKPENILITEPEGNHFTIRAVFSDFSVSRIDTEMTTAVTPPYRMTYSGFTSFEILQGNKHWTKAVDIFSLGCIYYFIITGGKQLYYSDTEIMNNEEPRMQHLKEQDNGFREYLPKMIRNEPKERVNCDQILNSPLFFTPHRTLEYLTLVANWIISGIADSQLVEDLEKGCKQAINDDWKESLSTELCQLLKAESGLKYNYKSVRDLLRLIRNKGQHYDELPPNMKLEFQSYPEGYIAYFTRRFPNLIWHVYNIFKELPAESQVEIRRHKECQCEYAPPEVTESSNEMKTTIKAHNDKIHHVTFSNNGEMVASSSADCQVKIWKLDNSQLIHSKNMDRSVLFTQFNCEDKLLLVCIGIEIHILKVAEKISSQCHVSCKIDPTYGSWFAADVFLSGEKDKKGSKLWLNKVPPDITKSNEIKKLLIFTTKDDIKNSKIVQPSSGKKLLVSQFGQRLRITEMEESHDYELQKAQRNDNAVKSNDINCNGNIRDFQLASDKKSLFVMICTPGNGYQFAQINLDEMKMTAFKLKTSVPEESALGDYATTYFDNNGYNAISVNSTKDAFLWNLKVGKYTKLAHEDKVSSVSFNPCQQQQFVTASFDGIIKVWEFPKSI